MIEKIKKSIADLWIKLWPKIKGVFKPFIEAFYRSESPWVVSIRNALHKALKSINFQKKSFQKQAAILGAGILVGFFALYAVLRLGGLIVTNTCVYILDSGSGKSFAKRLKPAPVEAYKVTSGTISKRLQTVGRLRPNEVVMLKSEISGRITEIKFRQGSEVKKGDILIQFDDADSRAELKDAEARLEQAKAAFKRINELKSKNIESGKNYDEAKAALDIAEAQVALRKARLEKMQIIAPFDGTIGIIDQSVGAYVQQGTDLVTLVDNNPMKIEFNIPEKNIHDIGAGQIAEIKLDGFPDQIFRATIEAVDSKVDEKSHSIAVRGTIPNPEYLLRGGLFSNVSLIIGEKGDAILIPESALEREGEIEFVWIIKNNKATHRRILTGTKENSKVEAVAGLNSGEVVVTAGQMRLGGDGHPVHMLNLNEDGSEKPKEQQKTLKDVESEDEE